MKILLWAVLIANSILLTAYGQSAPPAAVDSLPDQIIWAVPSRHGPVPPRPGTRDELVALGRRLFFDTVFSRDGQLACASCHRPDQGFASSEKVALGIEGRRGSRNTPTVFNRGFGGPHFWDGRARTLEEQVLLPVENPLEFDHSVPKVLKSLRADPVWSRDFARVFPREGLSSDTLARSLAAFVRSLVLADSPVDRFHRGESTALTMLEKRGLWIFESKGQCWQCHSGFNFSDEAFHNTGISWRQEKKDPGRGAITGNRKEMRAFKTPTLRGLVRTAPYMHDGSLATLEEVVDYYDRGGEKADPLQDARIRPLHLTKEDKAALVALLKALSRNAFDSSRGK